MKNRGLGIFLWIFGGILLLAGAIGIIMYFALSQDGGEKKSVILIISIVGIAVSFIPLIVGYMLAFKGSKEARERIAVYSSYPVYKIDDYKKELEEVRKNFASDGNPEKNRVAVFKFPNSEKCYDFSVIGKGKIYYAYLVSAYPPLYDNNSFARLTLPAVAVYSTDEYFESNPLALKKIAQKVFAGRNSNMLKDDANYFTNVKLTADLTDGREVYITTVMVYRMHLPLYCLSDGLFPVVADPAKSSSAFIVDFKYWTEKLTGNFCHASAHNEKIKEQPKDGIFDI